MNGFQFTRRSPWDQGLGDSDVEHPAHQGKDRPRHLNLLVEFTDEDARVLHAVPGSPVKGVGEFGTAASPSCLYDRRGALLGARQ